MTRKQRTPRATPGTYEVPDTGVVVQFGDGFQWRVTPAEDPNERPALRRLHRVKDNVESVAVIEPCGSAVFIASGQAWLIGAQTGGRPLKPVPTEVVAPPEPPAEAPINPFETEAATTTEEAGE